MFGTRQQTWLVVDIGGRWIKCARYVRQSGRIREAGKQVIDIQAEGLLSTEEVGAAIGRVLRAAGEHSLAVVLPQGSAVSQVVDLPEPSAGEASPAFEVQLLDLIGLSAERCVYDSQPLSPFGAYAQPQWTTVAKEESLNRQISPLLGQGLRVEAVTTVGNALVAAFRRRHPEVEEACLVDLGATQTTLVQLKRGEPIQMTSLIGGGENWTEALVETSHEAFEEVEARLFQGELLRDPVLGPALLAKVETWRERVLRQIEEWQDEPELSRECGPVYLFGGYAAIPGLGAALSASGDVRWNAPQSSDEATGAVWAASYGAALMATGMSGHKASILPRSLVKLRERRLAFSRLKAGVLYLFLILVLSLVGATFKQNQRLEALGAAKEQAEASLAEIQATKELLERRDKLAAQIEPMVRAQWHSLASVETFRRIQRVQRDYDFTLTRFADQRTYFHGLGQGSMGMPRAEPGTQVAANHSTEAGPDSERQAFVVELILRGSQAERLQVLGEIVGRLREESYFANVDRLVRGAESAASGSLQEEKSYALLLTLAGELLPKSSAVKKGVSP